MLTEFFAYLRNWFYKARWDGRFTINNGELQAQYASMHGVKILPLLDGQYFKIDGSILNDGVHRYPASGLKDEVFEGTVYSMAVPEAVLALLDDVQKWQDKYGAGDSGALSPFTGETLEGVYSYSKSTSSRSSDGGVGNGTSWQSIFADRLALWRKI